MEGSDNSSMAQTPAQTSDGGGSGGSGMSLISRIAQEDERGGPEGGARTAGDVLYPNQSRGQEPAGKADGGTRNGEAGQNGQNGQDGQSKQAGSPEHPDSPEGYALTFAKDTVVDKELLSTFQETVYGMGLGRPEAQKLASLYEAHVKGVTERAAQAQAQTEAGWEEKIRTSPDFDNQYHQARAAFRRYGDTELRQLMEQSHLGSHPAMWAFMARVGKALAEPGIHRGEAPGREKSHAENIYPNLKPY